MARTILEAYLAGATLQQLSSEFGMGHASAKRWLRAQRGEDIPLLYARSSNDFLGVQDQRRALALLMKATGQGKVWVNRIHLSAYEWPREIDGRRIRQLSAQLDSLSRRGLVDHIGGKYRVTALGIKEMALGEVEVEQSVDRIKDTQIAQLTERVLFLERQLARAQKGVPEHA